MDESGLGAGIVYLAYYTTENDRDHAGIEVALAHRPGGVSPFSAPTFLTTAPNDYQADPLIQLGVAPENGDYFQAVAEDGYVHFNANYEQKSSPAALGIANDEPQPAPFGFRAGVRRVRAAVLLRRIVLRRFV